MEGCMREICIKQTESSNHHRKNLSIVELIRQDGMVARAEKKFCYYIFEQNSIQDPEKLKNWMDTQALLSQKKDRHVSIRKIFDNKSGVGQMAYRVIGSYYVVQDLHIFAVVFMHSIKFDMLSKFPPKQIA
jgi:hypothetical protein